MLYAEQKKEKTFRFASSKTAYYVAFEKLATFCHYFEFDVQGSCVTIPAGCPAGVVNTMIQYGGTLVA